MVARYFELKKYFPTLQASACGPSLAPYFLSVPEDLLLKELYDGTLQKLHSVTLALQRDSLTVTDVRALFDKVCTDFPKLSKYLKPDSRIVKFPHFENGLCKLSSGKESELSLMEANALSSMLLSVEVVEEVPAPVQKKSKCSYADDILFQAHQNSPSTTTKYLSTTFIPPTSVSVERFFSVAGYVLGERRLAILPIHAEEQLFLRVNRSFWSEKMLMETYREERANADAEGDIDDNEVIVIDDDEGEPGAVYDSDRVRDDVIVID